MIGCTLSLLSPLCFSRASAAASLETIESSVLLPYDRAWLVARGLLICRLSLRSFRALL